MSSESRANLAASIRARLLGLAKTSGEDYQRVLGRYGIERFLYRLGNSSHRDGFALKGATLFTLWTGQTHRPTKDLDLLGRGSSAIDDVEAVMREICEIEDHDGIVFDAKSVEGTKIKEDDEYDGVRIKLDAHLAGARIPMQVDIGFGDAVYPEPELASFPVLLPMAAPQIRAYPRESAIAEKLHAMVELGMRNTRMKDFYDIWYMAQTWSFEMRLLSRAITVAFERRGLSVPESTPFALTADFLNDSQKKQQWNAFISRFSSAGAVPSLGEVGTLLRTFLHHLIIVSQSKSAEEREFYLRTAIRESWSSRQLERQIKGALFERVILSPATVSAPLRQSRPEAINVFRDTYMLEFLGLPPGHSEADLHASLLLKLKDFLIELGQDFCFVRSEYPVQVGGRDFALDLLFFHRGLNCLVAFELKVGRFEPEYLGKLEFYLEALDRDVRKPHERPAIGVLLCASKDKEVVEYALSRTLSPALIAEYRTRLPDKNLLQSKLHEFYLQNTQNESQVEEWLRESVTPAYDAQAADVSGAQVRSALSKAHKKAVAKKK